MRKFILPVCLVFLTGVAAAQSAGDHTTAGYSGARTYLNSDQGDFAPPLELFQTVELAAGTMADSLIVFSSGGTRYLLVGESAGGTVTYRAIDESTGEVLWSSSFLGTEEAPNYIPAFADNVVILGGPATSTVKAIRVSDGAELWQDTSVGSTTARHPLNTAGRAVYSGRNKVVSVAPSMGPSPSFWEFATTTAEAPLSTFGNRLYFLEDSGTLRSFNVDTGSQVWSRDGLGTSAGNIISTEALVFISTNDGAAGIRALSAADGSTVWSAPTPPLASHPPMAFAYGQLLVFTPAGPTGRALIAALNPDTGETLWVAGDSSPGLEHALVANNLLYYYQEDDERIRVRNAFNGRLVGGFGISGVLGMSASGGNLYLLFNDRIEIYRSIYELVFAQIADGGGQQTIITLSNAGVEDVTATIALFDPLGNPISFDPTPQGEDSTVEVLVPARETIQMTTPGGDTPTAGWARVVSDGPLAGNAVYQFIGPNNEILNEAGVAAPQPTGLATGLAIVERPPTRPQTVSTAVAIANTSNKNATLTFTLIDSQGTEVGQAVKGLGGGSQMAQFIDQIFDFEVLFGDPNAEFTGSVTIRSDVPVVVTALRTQGGLQLSSYDFGQ